MWWLIQWIIVGGIIGVIARFIVPGEDPVPWWGTILLGIGGAVIGGWLARFITPNSTGVHWIASIIGAVILVLILRFIRRSQAA